VDKRTAWNWTGSKTKSNHLQSGTRELAERALTEALGKGVSQPPSAGHGNAQG